jgi:uncharacterized protein (DUF1330 family)
MSNLEPTPEQLAAVAARPADAPLVMVNLMKFNKPDGLASYMRYVEAVVPHLQRAGATLRYAGASPAVAIGEGERPWWDAIVIVEYPRPQAWVDMITTPEYAEIHVHRAAGLDRGDIVATSVWEVGEI